MTDGSFTITAAQLVVGAVLLGCGLWIRGVRSGKPGWKTALCVAAVTYSAWVLAVTVLPLTFGRPGFSMAADPDWRNSVNLVPLRTIRLYLRSSLVDVARVNLLENLALLAPLGCAVPLLWKRADSWLRVALVGALSATAIELLQFARRYVLGMAGRSVDIDDVILNTVGVMLGYALYRIVRALRKPLEQ
ncbi:MAG: VanZ family protein [Coriobacteriia bacterium]|nr:VanZ family protein [Coriobacteriia bacterium]